MAKTKKTATKKTAVRVRSRAKTAKGGHAAKKAAPKEAGGVIDQKLVAAKDTSGSAVITGSAGRF